jgi:ABC-type multidrug transport system ATPase subunit
MSTLEIDRLCKTYPGGVQAMDDVSLRLEDGMFGLLGPNGAGKSTLMRTLAGLQAPDAGSVTFNSIDILARPREVRRRLGYLPQEFGVYPGISAERLLDHIAVLKGIESRAERREQVAALLELTNLRAARKRAVSTFSGGMKQRFGIAQALLGRPELIIVDEPTAGLDPEERRRFHYLLDEIGERVVVLLSTHIVDDVRDLCPRMAILVDGRVVRQGRPLELVRSLRGRLWRKRIERGKLEAHRRAYPVISSRLSAGSLHVHAVAADRPGEGFEAIEPTLEDVYFSTLKSPGAPS